VAFIKGSPWVVSRLDIPSSVYIYYSKFFEKKQYSLSFQRKLESRLVRRNNTPCHSSESWNPDWFVKIILLVIPAKAGIQIGS